MSAHWALKVLAVGMLYVFFGHPGIYGQLWERRLWFAIVAAGFTVPVVTWECFRILFTRFRFTESGFEIRMPLQTLSARFSDIDRLERSRGNVRVTLIDGNTIAIPWLVGDLDYVLEVLQQPLPH